MIAGILPARYASTRFPGKALADLSGKPLIQRVYEQCLKAQVLDAVIVATDHPDIFETVKSFGGKVVMTSPSHPSGTDRCAEAVENLDFSPEYVINIQGDEPFVLPEQIASIAHLLSQENAEIATLMHPIASLEELTNPAVVKVVATSNSHALYFSRQAVPFVRDSPQNEWLGQQTFFRHLGLYGFKTSILKELTQLKPSPLEQSEKLEQLRWLEAGYQIKIAATHYQSIGIDTPQDLEKAIAYFQKHHL